MEIRATNSLSNLKVTPSASNDNTSESRPNAFGIGSANQPEVQLSPQARILQQNEETQNQRRETFERQRADQREDEGDQPPTSNNEFVRVSSSVGSSQSNNLTTEKATELYRSIQDLL